VSEVSKRAEVLAGYPSSSGNWYYLNSSTKSDISIEFWVGRILDRRATQGT
jgi:hypothetical protein